MMNFRKAVAAVMLLSSVALRAQVRDTVASARPSAADTVAVAVPAGTGAPVAVRVDTVAVADTTVAAVADTLTAASGTVADTLTAVAPAVVPAVADSVAAVQPVAADSTAVQQAALPEGPYLLANDLQSLMISFDGKGGSQTITVKSSTGWWYLDGNIPWCEVKNVNDSSFTLKCYVNSAPLARHSYIKVKTQDIEDTSVAIVQASLPDNFLSAGAWRDSLKNCREFQCAGRTLLISENEVGFEDCPNAWFYVGDVRRGRKTGHGCCYDRYGNLIYSGEFYKDIPAGEFPSRDDYSSYKFECQKFSNGTLYFGETRNGLRHGYGIFMSSDGTLWFGRWNCGQQIVSEGVVVTPVTSAFSDFD